MKKFEVWQGVLSSSGNGNIDVNVGIYYSFDDALRVFDSVKDDLKGWFKPFKESYLVSILYEVSDDFDDDFIIKRYEVLL